MILAITLFSLYSASAWVMLRSVSNAASGPLAWALALAAIFAHTDAIVRMMRIHGPFSIGLLEAFAARLDAGGAGLLHWHRAAKPRAGRHPARERGVRRRGRRDQPAAPTPRRTSPGWELTAHILLSMGAAALLFAAAVTALLLVFLDRRLRTRRLADLPSVAAAARCAREGDVSADRRGLHLLTLALLTGFVFVTDLFAQHLVHKTMLSLIAWVLFGVLLIGRIRYGWRGRSAVRWALSGFAFLILSYFGSKFALEIVFGRHWG